MVQNLLTLNFQFIKCQRLNAFHKAALKMACLRFYQMDASQKTVEKHARAKLFSGFIDKIQIREKLV